MEDNKKWLGVRVPSGWGEVAVNALKTLVIGLLALIAWDWIESGDFDLIGVGSNAVVVAVSLLVTDALLMRAGR